MIDDLTALRLQLDWGADEAIGDIALDRFRVAPLAAPVQASPGAAVAPPRPASAASTIEQLTAEIENFQGCKLRLTATKTVLPDGNSRPRLLVIGDAPGSEDDRSGRAFSGPEGAMFDRVMATAGLSRKVMLLTTLVPWRPPGGRPPTESEIQACLPFLQQLIVITRPDRLVLLGSMALKSVSAGSETMRRKRGSWIDVSIPLVETAIPSLPLPPLDQWLSSPTAKQRLWTDLLTLQKATRTA